MGVGGVLPHLTCITGCPGESGSGALPSGVPKEGAVVNAHTSACHRYLHLNSTVNDAPHVIVGGSLALPSFTRALVPGGSLAATPSFQLQGGALDVGFSEWPCIGVGARESPPTTGDALSLELGVRRATATRQGLTGCSQQPGHGVTASAAHGSVFNTIAEGRPPPVTVAPQGSCEQEPHRTAYSAYCGEVNAGSRRARRGRSRRGRRRAMEESAEAEAPAPKRLHVGQQPKVDSHDQAMLVDDSCCGSGLAQGASADTAELQAQVQALQSRAEYRNAGLSYAAARSLVVMKQQSMEAWLSRKTAQAGPELLEPVWSLARWQRSTACHEARAQWRGSGSRKRDSCKQMENDWELQMLENEKIRKKRKFQKN